MYLPEKMNSRLLRVSFAECWTIQKQWQVTMLATCQLQGSPALKHTLFYGLFYSKGDHNLLNEHHAVLTKTWN